MFMARFIPGFLLSSVAGVYVDRWDRRRTLIVTNAALALIILPLLAIRSLSFLWLVYLVAFAESAASQLLGAEAALLPRLVPAGELVAANALNAVSGNAARLIGPAIAGVLMAAVGLSGVVAIDAASYLVAGLMAAAVHVPPPEGDTAVTDESATGASALERAWAEWRSGVEVVRRDRLLLGVFLVWGLAALAEGSFEVLVVPWVHLALHGGALQFGWLMGAQAIGGLLGGLCIGWAGRHLHPAHMIAGSMLAIGAADITIWNTPHLLVDLAVIAVVGLPATGFTVGTTTLLQRNVADAFRGRVGGALGAVWSASILLAMGAASLLGSVAGVVTVLNASGALALLTGVTALRLREHDPDEIALPSS
jgi:predicted MFS family arabinose efflux permease